MKEENEIVQEQTCNCKEACNCGCQEGKECTCDNEKCNCQENDGDKCSNNDKHDKKHKKENKLKEELKKLEIENQELVNKVKASQAELINYRKRKDEEVNTMLKFANKDIIMELISLVDNFERAIKLDDNDLSDELSKFLDGFKMMYATLNDILKKYGVEEINRVGEVFDPTQEEALITDSVSDMEDEVVIEVLLKGYKLKGRVIRPASVKINNK